MLPHFLSLRPASKREALSYLADLDDPAVIAGGTDLIVRMKKGESHLHLVDVTPIKELSGTAMKDKRIVAGAATSLRELSMDPLICESAPALAQAASWIGSPQIRNVATIGGNLVNASPAADSIPPLLVHDAQLTLESRDHVRIQALEAFITEPYKTTITATEMLSAISLEPLKGYAEGYKRVAKRAAWAISRLGIAWAISEKDGTFVDVRLAIGSCTPTPFRVRNVETFLIGKKRQNSVIADAISLCLNEIRRISGERPSFVYKLPVVRDLLHGILGGA
jgi:CO/xanthine dehydrogenase FAD-binding subunit